MDTAESLLRRKIAANLLTVARACSDPAMRERITRMASEYVQGYIDEVPRPGAAFEYLSGVSKSSDGVQPIDQ
jgi:hypothetical protein